MSGAVTAAPPVRAMESPRSLPEAPRLGRPVLIALGINAALLLAGFLGTHKDLLDLLKDGQTEAIAPPVAEEQVVQLDLSPVPPPPPDDHVEFVKPVEVVKQEEPPPPKPVPKPPVPPPPAPVSNNSYVASSFKVGDPNLPKPPYPAQAKQRRQQGTVVLSITMSAGHVMEVSVAQSSGYGALDSTSRQWAETKWTFPAKYTGTYQVPVDYHLSGL